MTKKLIILLASLVLVVPFLFYGCTGDDGSDGAKGATGATGATGAAGPVTNTNESCMVCHTDGKIADVSDVDGVHFTKANTLPNLTVDNIVVSDNGAGGLVVNFNVKIDGKTPYTALADNASYFFAADLVPAGTVAAMLDNTPQDTAQFERWAFERTGTFNTAGIGVRDYVFGTLDKTGAATGDYKYTFATPLGSTTAYDNAQLFNASHVQRVYIRVAHTVSNTYTAGVGFVDFTLDNTATPLAIDNANIGYLSRQFGTIEACQKCHGPKNQVMDHGSSYMDIPGCVVCHSPIANANNGAGGGSLTTKFYMVDLWFGKMIHRIHAGLGETLTNKPQAGDVVFPQDIRNCVACHSNPSGKTLGAGDQLANWSTNPSAAYCGTCHVGFPNTSHKATYNIVQASLVHPGGTSLTTTCSNCHPSTGPVTTVQFPVQTVHNTSPEAGSFNAYDNNVPEFNVTLTLDPVKAFYAAGDNVTVKATLTKHPSDNAVATTLYTTAQDNAGIVGGGLRVANLAFYGPRAMPKPIFAPTTAGAAPPQTKNFFVSTTDTNVATDNTGFKYKVTIPAGVKPGNYGVRVRFADYGRVGTGNSKVESIGFTLVRVGDNTTVDAKVAGDICVNCHGAPPITFEGHNERHVVVWDTDQCNSCHDYSGNHAAVLSNRVHAVHSANTLGDMLNTRSMQTTSGGFNAATIDVDWSDIAYPQSISNCATCHASGNTSYRSVVHEVSCLGCHGDNIYTGGASNHMLQSGGDWPAP